MLLLLAATLVAVLMLHYWHWTRTFWSRRGVVGVPGVPLVGSALALLTRTEYRGNVMQRFYTAARAQGLSCVGLFVATQPTLLVTDLGAVRDVLVKDFAHFMDHGKPVDRESDPLLSNCLFELAQHQDVQRRVRAELEAALAEHGGRLSHEALQGLAYMGRVLDETMRLHPPSNTATRAASQDYALPSSWATGCPGHAGPRLLRKGTKVVVPLLAIHRDPEFYPEPTAFDPDRFTEQAKQARPQYAFLPFGTGPRHCIGVRFAVMQMKLALAAVLRSFRVLPLEGGPPYPPRLDAKSFLTRVEGGNLLRVEPL